jgi:hypothetical protein
LGCHCVDSFMSGQQSVLSDSIRTRGVFRFERLMSLD